MKTQMGQPTDFERDLLRRFSERRDHMATLMAGVVYEVRWSANDVVNWSSALEDCGMEIAWLSDPLAVGATPGTHRVVIGPPGLHISAAGKRHRSSRLPASLKSVPPEPLAELRRALEDAVSFGGELTEPGWLVLRGAHLSRVDLLLGRKGTSPTDDLTTLTSLERDETFHGVILASVEAPKEWSCVDLGKRSLNVAKKQMGKGASQLRLLSNCRVAGDATDPSMSPSPLFVPSRDDLDDLLAVLADSAVDAFERPVRFEKLVWDADWLVLTAVIDGQQEPIELKRRGWADREELQDELVAAVGAAVDSYRTI